MAKRALSLQQSLNSRGITVWTGCSARKAERYAQIYQKKTNKQQKNTMLLHLFAAAEAQIVLVHCANNSVQTLSNIHT